ncbi:hypothetical protein PSEUDO8O_60063 [Pseudomonas sp. 8O]|nr:hypothetical protein PSEUDO8O_60063 [Pseudomonas sp. 8O]
MSACFQRPSCTGTRTLHSPGLRLRWLTHLGTSAAGSAVISASSRHVMAETTRKGRGKASDGQHAIESEH